MLSKYKLIARSGQFTAILSIVEISIEAYRRFFLYTSCPSTESPCISLSQSRFLLSLRRYLISTMLLDLLIIRRGVACQAITLTPTTIRGRTSSTCAAVTKTLVSVSTATVTSVSTSVSTSLQVSTSTATVRQTITSTATATLVKTTTVTTTAPCAPSVKCPTLTSTGTACKSCFVPQCTEVQTVAKPCGCPASLATTTVNFPCSDPDACNNIGCKTVYTLQTQAC